MDSSCTLDYATFQLSPRRSRCELFVSGNGKMEKLASGLFKPFLTHLKVAEEQAAKSAKSIKLEVEKRRNGATWFKKGTLERFIRFVSTPEVLELVNTFDAEMSQLEGARKMYSEGAGVLFSATMGENQSATSESADITKKELLKAIDLRLVAVKQDLTTACGRASSAGFTLDNVSELLLFANYFGADRLSEACTKFISLCQRRPGLISHQQQPQSLSLQLKTFDDLNLRSSASSDMSIDEPEVEIKAAGKPEEDHLQLQKSSNSRLQQLNTSELSGTSDQIKPMQRHSIEKPEERAMEGPEPSASAIKPDEQTGTSSRRLSVQDRISLFESKQKDQSTSSSTVSNVGAANRVIGGRREHRRLQSDVSEKSVLRRWSGASDMSIDLNINNNSFGDRKASGSVASTPTASDLQNQFSSKTEKTEAHVLMEIDTSWPSEGFSSFSSSQVDFKGFPKEKSHIDDNVVLGTIKTSMSQSKPALEKANTENQTNMSMVRKESDGSGYQDAFRTHQTAETVDSSTIKEPKYHHAQSELSDPPKMKDSVPLQFISDSVPETTDGVSIKKVRGPSPGTDGAGHKHQPPSVDQFRKFVRKINTEVKAKGSADSQIHFKTSSGSSMDSELSTSSAQRIIPGLQEDAIGINTSASEIFGCWPANADEGSTQQIDLHRQTSSPKFVKKSQGRRDIVVGNESMAGSSFPVSKVKDPKETLDQSSASSLEKTQSTRPSKGNQELNDELQIKANELEKLFAAHKLRIQNDQTTASKRGKPADVKEAHMFKAEEKRQSVLPVSNFTMETSNSETDFDANLLDNMVDSDRNSNISENLVRFSSSLEFRGKCYDKYMQKRDAKLLEEWGSNKAKKEAKMKAMHDNLECTQAEMRAKFTENNYYSRRRAENLRSFCSRSGLIIKNKEEDDLEEVYEQVNRGKDASFDDNASKGSQHKKLSAKNLSSSATQTSVMPVSKPSIKSINSVSSKHKIENPMAQLVPNLSDFRKENTKTSSATRRVSNQTRTRNFSHSKGIAEEAYIDKEDKTHRLQSLRTSTVCTGELKDISTLNLYSDNLTTSEICEEQPDLLKFQKMVESKKFSFPGLFKPKGSVFSEVNKIIDASEAIHQDAEDWERISAEENLEAITDFPLYSDKEMTRKNKEFENSDDPVSENGDLQRCKIQAACDTTDVSSKLAPSVGNRQESLGESSRSWNSQIHYSFSYVCGTSDVDAFVDSPIGSPASSNSNPLNQMVEGDAVRMRKKWGNAQIPVIVPNASQQSRKDVTNGFKRLLKFGRKNRGLESSTTDRVSSTASDGDDDTEDGSYLPTRPTDELKKSRTGFLLPPEYAFKECEMYPEPAQSLHSSIPNPPANFRYRDDHLSGSSLKATRSIFSLASFRSKGSESKLR